MHMKNRRRFLALLGLCLFAVMLAIPPAAAQRFDELRGSGVVGERYDGYAVVRDKAAGPRVLALVVKVNYVRQAAFARRAAEQDLPIDEVARAHARRNMLLWAPPGTWYLAEDGRWIRKKDGRWTR